MPLGIYRKRTPSRSARSAASGACSPRRASSGRASCANRRPCCGQRPPERPFSGRTKKNFRCFLRVSEVLSTVSLQLLTSVCFSPSLCRLPLILASAAGSSQSLCINAAVLKLHCASCYQTIKETLHHNSCTPFSVFVFLRSSFLISGIIIHRRGHKNKSQLL